MEACTPQGNEMCAIAKCTPPRPGCRYDMNNYINSEGHCCPAICKEVCGIGKYGIFYFHTPYDFLQFKSLTN